MRVYGASPLYSYVELVFRSKRLFIACILIATLLTAAYATLRAKYYSATAVILLSGNAETGTGVPDNDQLGSIRYKMSVLGVLTRDPSFYKDALRAARFDQGRSEVEFDELCKEARTSVSIGEDSNVLELTCRWPSPLAADIIKAIYDEYSRRVLSQETVLSTKQTKLITMLKDEYEQKIQGKQAQINAWKKQHFDDPLEVQDRNDITYANQKKTIADIQDELDGERQSYQALLKNLKNTPPEVVSFIGYSATHYTDDPQYRSLVEQQTPAQKAQSDAHDLLNKLKLQYTDTNPKVVAAQKALDEATANLKKINDGLNEIVHRKVTVGANPDQVHKVLNPQWSQLNAERTDSEQHLRQIESRLHSAQAEGDRILKAARVAPLALMEYSKISENLPLYTSIRDSLASRQEEALMAEQKDRELHLTEMTMMVPPEAQPELVGAKSMIFYAAGPLIGLVIAFAFSLVAESLDHSLRTPVDVEKHLGKPVLAVLPRMDVPRGAARLPEIGGESSQPSLPS